ncbi:MAG: hypothetical protein GY771_11455 [bacterium]|nr:hypothetical protein [bacterium]
MEYLFILICLGAVPVQVLVFLALMKLERRPGLLSYFGLIGLPLAVGLGGGLLPFALGLNGSTSIWDVFQVIVGVVTMILILQGFGFGVVLRRRAEGALHPLNIVGLMLLIATPLLLVVGAIVITYMDATIPVLMALSLYLVTGIFLLVRRWEEKREIEKD